MGELSDALDSLRRERQGHIDAIKALDRIIEDLARLVPQPEPAAAEPADLPAVERAGPPAPILGSGVRQMVRDLLDEAPRAWSAQEIIDEYERRGTPIQGARPRDSVFSAFSKLASRGVLRQVDRGRYISAKHGNGRATAKARPAAAAGRVNGNPKVGNAREGVMQVFTHREGEWLTVREIKATLEGWGWTTGARDTTKLVRAAVRHAIDIDPTIERRERSDGLAEFCKPSLSGRPSPTNREVATA